MVLVNRFREISAIALVGHMIDSREVQRVAYDLRKLGLPTSSALPTGRGSLPTRIRAECLSPARTKSLPDKRDGARNGKDQSGSRSGGDRFAGAIPMKKRVGANSPGGQSISQQVDDVSGENRPHRQLATKTIQHFPRPVYKPHSVSGGKPPPGDHLSGPCVSARLLQPTRDVRFRRSSQTGRL